MQRLFQVSSKVCCEQECWHLSLTPPVSTTGFSIECLRRSVPALAFTGEDRDSSKGLQGLQPPHYTPVLTVSQGTGNLWLPSTALWVLPTLQPYTGLVSSMGEDLQAVQGWVTSAFPMCNPVVLIAHLPCCISTVLHPQSWAHPCPTWGLSNIKVHLYKEFSFKAPGKEPASMYWSIKTSV